MVQRLLVRLHARAELPPRDLHLERSRETLGVDPQLVLDLSVYVIVSGVVGSRLLYVAFHIDEYRNLVDVFALWQGGATLYGGFALAIVVGYIFSQKAQRSVSSFWATSSAPRSRSGSVLTRVGCFLSGCCYGKETALPWGVIVPAGLARRGVTTRELAAGAGRGVGSRFTLPSSTTPRSRFSPSSFCFCSKEARQTGRDVRR